MLITMNYYCRQRDLHRDRKVPTENYTLKQYILCVSYIIFMYA